MNRLLACALLLGLALRLGGAFRASDAPLIHDAALYGDIARNLAERGEFALTPGRPTVNRAPLYPFFLTPFARLSPGTWFYARVAQAALDTTTIVLVYFFGLFALGKSREAAAGAMLYAVHPVFIAYSATILSETLFLWIWMLSLCLLLKTEEEEPSRRRTAMVAASGVALGLGILCRPNLMLLPPGLAVILLAVHRGRAGLLRRLCFVVLFSYLTLIPWMARNRSVTGHWLVAIGSGGALFDGAQVEIPEGGGNGLFPSAVGKTEFEADAELIRLAKLEYRRNAPAILLTLPKRLVKFWLTSHSAMFGIDKSVSEYRAEGRWAPILARAGLWGLHLVVLLLSAWGLWSARQGWTMACTLAVIGCAYFSGHIFAAYWMNRYHLPGLILCLTFAGAALVRLSERRAA